MYFVTSCKVKLGSCHILKVPWELAQSSSQDYTPKISSLERSGPFITNTMSPNVYKMKAPETEKYIP